MQANLYYNNVGLGIMKRILLVDDDRSMSAVLKMMLSSVIQNSEIDTVYSIKEALIKIKGKYDALIVDHNLGDGIGLKLLDVKQKKNVFYYSGHNLSADLLWPMRNVIVEAYNKQNCEGMVNDIASFFQAKTSMVSDIETLGNLDKNIAAEVYKSAVQFDRDFKEITGTTKRSHKNKLKVKIIFDLLEKRYCQWDICDRLGYSGPRSLRQFLKNQNQPSPSAFLASLNDS